MKQHIKYYNISIAGSWDFTDKDLLHLIPLNPSLVLPQWESDLIEQLWISFPNWSSLPSLVRLVWWFCRRRLKCEKVHGERVIQRTHFICDQVRWNARNILSSKCKIGFCKYNTILKALILKLCNLNICKLINKMCMVIIIIIVY